MTQIIKTIEKEIQTAVINTLYVSKKVEKSMSILRRHMERNSMLGHSSFTSMCICAKSLQSCSTLGPYGLQPPCFSIQRIFQARILKWQTCPPPRGLPYPGIEPKSLTPLSLAGSFFTTSTIREALHCHDLGSIPGHRTKIL